MSLTILLLLIQEEYDRKLVEALSQEASVDHGFTLQTWTNVAAINLKGSYMELVI